MNIWIIDINKKRRNKLIRSILDNGYQKDRIKIISSIEELVNYSTENICDVLFVCTDKPELDWVAIVSHMKQSYPDCNLIVVNATTNIDISCAKYRISGYLQEPITLEKVKTELENLRYSVY